MFCDSITKIEVLIVFLHLFNSKLNIIYRVRIKIVIYYTKWKRLIALGKCFNLSVGHSERQGETSQDFQLWEEESCTYRGYCQHPAGHGKPARPFTWRYEINNLQYFLEIKNRDRTFD